MKTTRAFPILFVCAVLLLAHASAQENAPSKSWLYVTMDDFMHDNRQFPDEYAVAPGKGESPYKDSLKLVYAVKPVDEKGDGDVAKNAWGVVSDGKLYVNNQMLNGGKGFSKAFSTGRYNLLFVTVKESPASRKQYGYTKDDVRFYEKKQGKHRGTVNVGGIGVGLGSATILFIPVVADRETGELTACSQAYMEQLAFRHPEVPPVLMNEARGVRLIEYFRHLNSLE